MNKYQEAYDRILTATNNGDGLVAELNTIKELVDKATPQVQIKHENYRGGYYRCPTCDWNLGVLSDIDLYCEKCGQALDKGKAYEFQ